MRVLITFPTVLVADNKNGGFLAVYDEKRAFSAQNRRFSVILDHKRLENAVFRVFLGSSGFLMGNNSLLTIAITIGNRYRSIRAFFSIIRNTGKIRTMCCCHGCFDFESDTDSEID